MSLRDKFIDQANIYVRSGKGGPGCVAFRREKFVPFGGPNGGDGGTGGDVIVVADRNLSTLLDYRFQRRHIAESGQPGEGQQKTGRDGEHAILRVPVGTTIDDADTGERVADLNIDGEQVVLLKGGRGGKGNEHFKSSTRQAPRISQPGEPAQERNLRLELKLLADVGVVGFPNVGKSSLVARVSAAKPKVADYPFTTLTPNLGVVRFGDMQHFVMADVPGLIVDAHKGSGLGSQFLRHIERVRTIVHMVTAGTEEPGREPIADFEAIENELLLHNAELAQLPRVLVLNRIDLPFVAEQEAEVRAFAHNQSLPFFAISSVTGAGVDALVNYLGEMLSRTPYTDTAASKSEAMTEAGL